MEEVTHPHTGDPRCTCDSPAIAARLDIDEPCIRYTWKGKPITGAGVAKHLAERKPWNEDIGPEPSYAADDE